MKVNTKIRYGLRTVIEIGCHDNTDGIYQKDIAKDQEISEKYLDPIISSLKASGIIKNVGGKKSGYVLNRALNEISVLDIFQSFENGPYLVDCTSRMNFCNRAPKCASREFWCGLNNMILEYCKNTTIESLVDRCRDLNTTVEDTVEIFERIQQPKEKKKKIMQAS